MHGISGDLIDQLPEDQTTPSHNEIQIVDMLFKEKQRLFDKILSNTKDVLLVGVLYVVFSVPEIDNLIKKFVPMTRNSEYILTLVKALLFMSIYYILNNIHLARK